MKKSKNRWLAIQTMLLIFTFGLFLNQPQMQVSAAEEKTGISSTGSIVYKNGTNSAAIYAEDIALLQEKLCSVRAETYDPASYGPVYQRESTDITESAYAGSHEQYDALDDPDNCLIVSSEASESPEDAADADVETPEPPEEEAGVEVPELPKKETETGAESPESPKEETETGAEAPKPSEKESEIGAEAPEPPKEEMETGTESPDPSGEETVETPPVSLENEAVDANNTGGGNK